MATLEDLRADAVREEMWDRCDALHEYPYGPEAGCPICEEKAQIRREDCICGGPDATGDCRSNGCDPECPECSEETA